MHDWIMSKGWRFWSNFAFVCCAIGVVLNAFQAEWGALIWAAVSLQHVGNLYRALEEAEELREALQNSVVAGAELAKVIHERYGEKSGR